MQYYQEQDRKVAFHYARSTGNIEALEILERGEVNSKEEAQTLSEFYWEIVSASVGDRDHGSGEPFENMDSSLEGLHNTFSIHLCNAGFEEVWDEVVDKQ